MVNGNGRIDTSPDDEGFYSQRRISDLQDTQTQMSTMQLPALVSAPAAEVPEKDAPVSPNLKVQTKSPTRSTASNNRKPLKALRPFIVKKRKIVQSDDEEGDGAIDGEHEIFSETALAGPSERQNMIPQIVDRHAFSREKVEAWRFCTSAAQHSVLVDAEALAMCQTRSSGQQREDNEPTATVETPSEEPQLKTRKSVKRAPKPKKTNSTSASKRKKTA